MLICTVQFDNNTYLVGQNVTSTLNLGILGVGYAYRLLKTPRYRWIGAHGSDVKGNLIA